MANDYGFYSYNGTTSSSTEEVFIPRSQVYQATHDSADERLAYRYRSFISFKYGGKWIEDFDLIASIDGDRMQRSLSGEFNDLTSSYDILDGQFYHSTHFRSNTLHFTLATDGIDGRKLEEFRHYFAGGPARELILSEHPNRAIMARVARPPELNMLPFEKVVTFSIAGVEYTTSVTNFKGTINLEFVMDEPFWYSIINVFGDIDQDEHYINSWEGVDYFGDNPAAKDKLQDVLKIVYEDGIPLYHMIAAPMLFGGDVYAMSGGRLISKICAPSSEEEFQQMRLTEDGYYSNGLVKGVYFDFDENDQPIYEQYYKGATIDDPDTPNLFEGVVDGAYMVKTSTSAISLTSHNYLYLYYAGTAPAPITLKFAIVLANNGSRYCSSIASDYVESSAGKPYNTLTFQSEDIQELRFTTPNFITSYNNLIYLLTHLENNITWEGLRSLIRDEIRHPEIRRMATNLINGYVQAQLHSNDLNIQVTSGAKDYIANVMSTIFTISATATPKLELTLNSKTGEAIGRFTYNEVYLDYEGNPQNQKKILEENIGDMLNSNYIVLRERNTLSKEMQVEAWTPESPTNSYRIYHDFPVNMENISIEYKNLYY